MAASVRFPASRKSPSHRAAASSTALVAHRLARVAASLRTAARDAGVELTQSYAEHLVVEGLAKCDQLGVTRLGDGVVIHTAPDSRGKLPVVLGIAGGGGEWLRDGRRHFPREGQR